MTTFRSLDLDAIDRLAQLMVRELPSRLTIGLVGTLGAGKTTLTQSIASAAGVDTADVTSPTFTLLQSHRGVPNIHHLDAYRVADEDEFLELGVEELFEEPNTWTLVEWADLVRDVMPPDTLWVRIELEPGSDRRSVTLECDDAAQRKGITRLSDLFS